MRMARMQNAKCLMRYIWFGSELVLNTHFGCKCTGLATGCHGYWIKGSEPDSDLGKQSIRSTTYRDEVQI